MKYIQQHDDSDCGCACIAMISDFFKCRINYNRIREISGTDRNGTNLNGMIIAAKSFGFNVHALKGEKQNLYQDLPCPFIANLKIKEGMSEYTHYVVIRKLKSNKIYIYDPNPIFGKCVLTIDEFCKKWTGICIFLSPSKEFKIQKDEKKITLFRFIPLLKPYIGLLSTVCLISLILSLFGIVTSFYSQYVIDEVIYSNSITTLTVLSIGVLLVTIFRALFNAIRSYMVTVFSTKMDFQIIYSYFNHVLRLPVSFFDTRKTGDILSRRNDAQKIRDTLTDAAVTIGMDVLMVIVVGFILVLKNRILFSICVIIICFSSIVVWVTAKPFAKKYRKFTTQNAAVDSYLVEILSGGTTIKALNASKYVFSEYEKLQIKSVLTFFKLNIWQIIRNIFTEIINDGGGNVIFWIGSYFVLKDKMTLGELFSFNSLLGYFLGPFYRLINLQPNLQEAFVSVDRIAEVLELEEEFNEKNQYIKPQKIKGELLLKNVDFTYGTRQQVLFNINASIKKGEWVALVGESGSGKSTIVKLLLKFYQPQKGEIFLDNNNLKDIDTCYLRDKIGYVPQEIFLFSGTIAENISLHKPNATMEEIIEVSKKAGAHEFISKLPNRYNTKLAERGSSLSGGERQRIALARALLGQPELLIFDEATSNLDNISEYNIYEILRSLRNEKITTILIAHRLTTVVNCDRIFVLENGKIVEEGTHEELKVHNGLYQKMWECYN